MKRCRTIAVAGPKGSTGCTFVAVGLASRLIAEAIPTLLIDADAEEAGVASHLDLRCPVRPTEIPSMANAIIAAAEQKDGLSCLDIRATEAEVGPLLASAREAYRAVVVDLGHQAGDAQRALAAAADWLVWVVAPDRVGVERADRAIGGTRLHAASVAIVLNRAGYGFRDAGVVLGERHGLPLITVIPERPRAAREALRRCLAPDRFWAFRRPFAELARCLHPDACGRAGTTWP